MVLWIGLGMDGSPGGVRYRAPYGNHSDAYIRILSRGEQMPGADFWQNEINVTKKQPLKGVRFLSEGLD